MTFSGFAPKVFSKIAPPQYFSITLIASSHKGFASACQTFDVVIGAHTLEIVSPTDHIDTVIDTPISYDFRLNDVQLDGQAIDRSNISFISANLGRNGKWLKFDNSSLVLSGKPSQGDQGTTVQITVQDIFADTVRSTIQVDVYQGLITTLLPSVVNATVGQRFNMVLNDSYFSSSDVQVGVKFTPKNGDNWLSYDSDSRTISGTPETNKATLVNVDINAFSQLLSQKQTASSPSKRSPQTEQSYRPLRQTIGPLLKLSQSV
jgi:hypothetical protein